MLIDWFTVISQIINFLILIFLLKRFLYRPILKAIDAREERITNELQAAEIQKSEAAKNEKKYQDLLNSLEANKTELITKAEEEVALKKTKWLEDARKTYQDRKDRLMESLHQEEHEFHIDLKRKFHQEIFGLVRKTLMDLADESLEESLSHIFLKKCKSLSPDELEKMRKALKENTSSIDIITTYPLGEPLKKDLTDFIALTFDQAPPIRFIHRKEELPGIKLIAGGYKLEWTIAEYLDKMQADLEAAGTTATTLVGEKEER